MGDGLVDEAWWRGRQDDYLTASTARPMDPGSVLDVLDHLERRRRDPAHVVDVDAIDGDALASWFRRIDGWLDVADFDMVLLAHLLWTHGDELPASVGDAVAERFVTFKHWYTDPTPEGVIDQRWYWSENHRLIFHAVELLAGERFAEVTFTSDGATGDEHRRRAAGRLHAWFDEKAELGFSEWHSDVYYEKDIAPLLTLVELAEDERIAARAQAFLDLVLADIALHLQRGNLGCTHGRSYAKDKTRATDQLTFAAAKLCFDDTDRPYRFDDVGPTTSTLHQEGASLLARARRYRPPEVLRRIATHDEAMVDHQTMGLEIDPTEPLVDHPTRPDGRSYTDPDMVPFWWDRSALTPWQLVGLAMDALDRHDLWAADLFAAFRGVRDVTGGDRDVARRLALDLAPMINAGLLTRVTTTTWRTEAAMLSSAQSYRPGWAGSQHHVWQATLDEDAVLFTTHPGAEPRAGTDRWLDADRYWTGSATLPRVLQHRGAAVVSYAPAFASPELDLLAGFAYLPMTHAFFPTERFDEVTQEGHWTVGARRGGYVALWSWRPVRWRDHDPAVVCTNGLTGPFDLVAEGGAANVWLVQVGEQRRWGSLDRFVEAVAGGAVEVADHGGAPDGAHRGFDVAWTTAAEGALACGPTGPLTIDGVAVPIGGPARMHNPFASIPEGQTACTLADGEWSLELDLATGDRRAAGP